MQKHNGIAWVEWGETMYPKIHLAIDNCVFYKRWTKPDQWAEMISSLGLRYVEASADTELDPLYMGERYLHTWIEQVQNAEQKHNIKVCNLYSGHGTYTTLGLTHTEESVRSHMIKNWFFPMVEMAGKLKCGMGFFAHAFNHSVLQNCDTYEQYIYILTEALTQINQYAHSVGCGQLAIEQMYTPHQYPWRIRDTKSLIADVSCRSGHSFYFTEDVGHHHPKFIRPTKDMLFRGENLWLGSDNAFRLYKEKGVASWDAIEADMDRNPQLFTGEKDCDCYEIIRQLGCYSPIIHLQQTNGRQSAHLPFTPEENKKGIITGEKILRSLKASYDQPVDITMPERVSDIYLTLELFSGTTSIMAGVLEDCSASVAYWRQFIPKDGMTLDALVSLLEQSCDACKGTM